MAIAPSTTAVAPDGYDAACVDGGWSTPRGPNGGYIAAIMLRALAAAVDDPSARRAR